MKAPVHKAVMTRHLVLGGDREMVLTTALVVAALLYGVGGIATKALFLLIGGAVLMGLRELARRDPWYVPIMMRSRTLRGRYPARASASASE